MIDMVPGFPKTKEVVESLGDSVKSSIQRSKELQDAKGPTEDPSPGPVSLSIGALVFGAMIILVMSGLKLKDSIDLATFTKMSGLALVLSVGLTLIVAGYTQEQIAPMMGLLGTVAGYLLGKTEDGKDEKPAGGKSSPQTSVAPTVGQ
jgi:hypothetical protein